jgi:hypothetical protein
MPYLYSLGFYGHQAEYAVRVSGVRQNSAHADSGKHSMDTMDDDEGDHIPPEEVHDSIEVWFKIAQSQDRRAETFRFTCNLKFEVQTDQNYWRVSEKRKGRLGDMLNYTQAVVGHRRYEANGVTEIDDDYRGYPWTGPESLQ